MIHASVDDAARIIRQGGVVAYPTESCFGLGCDPSNISAIKRILEMKRRPRHKGLIVIGFSFDQISKYVSEIPDVRKTEIHQSWPGPNTWLLPASTSVTDWVRGDHDTIAVRVTAHDQAASLCKTADTAIISTSANRADAPPLRTHQQVELEFGDEVDCILEGETGSQASPTTIRNSLNGEVIRN